MMSKMLFPKTLALFNYEKLENQDKYHNQNSIWDLDPPIKSYRQNLEKMFENVKKCPLQSLSEICLYLLIEGLKSKMNFLKWNSTWFSNFSKSKFFFKMLYYA